MRQQWPQLSAVDAGKEAEALTGPSVPVQLQGTLRVILDPLLVDKPFVGAVTLFFLQKPVRPGDERQACYSCA